MCGMETIPIAGDASWRRSCTAAGPDSGKAGSISTSRWFVKAAQSAIKSSGPAGCGCMDLRILPKIALAAVQVEVAVYIHISGGQPDERRFAVVIDKSYFGLAYVDW